MYADPESSSSPFDDLRFAAWVQVEGLGLHAPSAGSIGLS